MTDLHSHILPGVDDGAKSVEKSIEMLSMLAEQGVETVAATSHFKPSSGRSVEEFVLRRDRAYAQLTSAVGVSGGLPGIVPAAEVTLCVDLADYDGLEKLCYRGTHFMLVELDLRYTGDWVLNSLYRLQNERSIIPVIAHIDRYIHFIPSKLIQNIVSLNCPVQFNAEAFSGVRTRRSILKLIERNPYTPFLAGSDCHNTDDRPPNMDTFEKKARKLLGDGFFDEVNENSRLLLKDQLIV